MAEFLRWLASPFCHQLDERTFCTARECAALCVRCLGMHGGFAWVWLVLVVARPLDSLDPRVLALAIVSLSVAAGDALVLDSIAPVRLLTGACGGAGLAILATTLGTARSSGHSLKFTRSDRQLSISGLGVAGALGLGCGVLLGAGSTAALRAASIVALGGLVLLAYSMVRTVAGFWNSAKRRADSSSGS